MTTLVIRNARVGCNVRSTSFTTLPPTLIHHSPSHFTPRAVPPLLSVGNQLVGVPVGYDVELDCTVEARPPALTYWTRGRDFMLHAGNKYHIKEKVNTYECYVCYDGHAWLILWCYKRPMSDI